jgi:uncharacterized membrane protein
MGEVDGRDTYRPTPMPVVRVVTTHDILTSLRAGVRDFLRAPLFGLFFGGVYAAGGLFILASVTYLDMVWLIIPIAIGFPLIGPFAAVGLYEVSRRLAASEPLGWRSVLGVVLDQRHRQLGWMSFVVLFIFWVWIYLVRILLALFFGFKSFSSVEGFFQIIVTTNEGLAFVGVGTLIGAFLAFILFSATVTAMPLLLERDIDFISAMITSFKSVLTSPVAMLGWGIVVTVLGIAAMVPAFLGMIVILPVLGHATWHLYVRAIESEDSSKAASNP